MVQETLEPLALSIPAEFQHGQPVEKIILICDVDGVVRNHTEADIDSHILSLIKALTSDQKVKVAFISGTPISQDPMIEIWRRGNHTLDKAVASFLIPELQEKKVTLFGSMGGQRMREDCHVEILDEYPIEITFEIGKLLLQAFLSEVEKEGSQQQKRVAKDLRATLNELKLKNQRQLPTRTADEFSEIIFKIHSQLDQYFRLVSYGAFVETQTSNPPWKTCYSSNWIKNQLELPQLLISQLSAEQKQVATGLTHGPHGGFNFLMVSKTNKGNTIKKYIEETLLLHPNSLIVTIGDTQVDYPMHQHAHLAYHVGQAAVWKNHPLPHCMLVLDKFGRDCQHVSGTVRVLNTLKNGLGKPLFKWNITP